MNTKPHVFSYESMGTRWEITLYDGHHLTHVERIESEIISMSDEFDKTYSRFIKSSLVWQIAKKAGTYEVPDDFINMLRLYMDLYGASQKKLNPLIGFTISDLGYDDQYSLIPKNVIRKTPDLLETVIISEKTPGRDGAHHAIETKEPVLFDFGALGKGYFVDKISNLLKEKGCKHFLVNGSGDIYYFGPEPINVGLEHPDDATKVIASTQMNTGSMCASGIGRRAWDKYHHVIDPATSNSAQNNIKATWVIAKTAALADALASCLFFVAPEALCNYEFQYVVMNSENRIKKSPTLALEL